MKGSLWDQDSVQRTPSAPPQVARPQEAGPDSVHLESKNSSGAYDLHQERPVTAFPCSLVPLSKTRPSFCRELL